MTVTVMKTTFEKLKPNIIHYRDYRKFSNDKFRENLISRLSTENIRVDCNGMEKFLQICIKTLDELAPQNSRGNNMPFIYKTIKKAFMMRSRLRNIYLKTVQITTNVIIVNRETIAYIFYEKQKPTIIRT